MKIKISLIFLFLLYANNVLSQNTTEAIKISGKITYQSSQNVYVQFESTDGISINDTLYIIKNSKLVPVLIVSFISSKSIAGKKLNKIDLVNEESIIAVSRKSIITKPVEVQKDSLVVSKDTLDKQNLL